MITTESNWPTRSCQGRVPLTSFGWRSFRTCVDVRALDGDAKIDGHATRVYIWDDWLNRPDKRADKADVQGWLAQAGQVPEVLDLRLMGRGCDIVFYRACAHLLAQVPVRRVGTQGGV